MRPGADGGPISLAAGRAIGQGGLIDGSECASAGQGVVVRPARRVYSIATVVDDFIDRVMGDPRLNANPRVDEAHHRVPPAGFKYLVTEMLCSAAGGPERYSGRAMEESHRHLRIAAGEWQAFMDDLQQTLDGFTVPAAEQAEVKALVESTRGGIVVG